MIYIMGLIATLNVIVICFTVYKCRRLEYDSKRELIEQQVENQKLINKSFKEGK